MNTNQIEVASKRKFIDSLKLQGISNDTVLDCMLNTPRELFIEPALRSRAYDQDALPIGFSQTISSPYIVAKMSQLIFEQDSMTKVLEVGTGCGYQTAILSSMFKKVISIERIKSLHEKAKENLSKLHIKNVKLVYGDGYQGFRNESPFDAIILTAAPKDIPKKLIQQLSVNGRMILPLEEHGTQKLYRIKNTKNGYTKKDVDDVLFVPMLEGID